MLISESIPLGKTKDGDLCVSVSLGDKAFPFLYMGKGSYCGMYRIYTMANGDERDNAHFIQIGRYTSIGDNFSILCNMNHDMDAVWQGVVLEFGEPVEGQTFRRKLGQCEKNLHKKGTVIIGSDVWIGNDVTILPNVVIGDGAVIGAGSLVTKDIPPYAIYAGNPAKLIRYRFSEENRNGLEKIRWWRKTGSELLNMKEDMMGFVDTFVEKYSKLERKSAKIDNHIPTIKRGEVPILLLFVDVDTQFPTFRVVAEAFCRNFNDGTAEMILAYNSGSEDEIEAVGSLTNEMSYWPYDEALFSTLAYKPAEEDEVICSADYLFMGRTIDNIMRTDSAFKYGVKCLSGTDVPIFDDKLVREIKSRNKMKG